MAWANLQNDMQTFFKNIAEGVREDMDKTMVHWVEINYRSAALGFHKAAQKISGETEYLPNGKQVFVNIIKDICTKWVHGQNGTEPGDVFRTVNMRNGNIRNISIGNAKVVKSTAGSVTVQIAVPSGSGEIKASKFLQNFRNLVWKEFNELYTEDKTKKPLPQGRVWQDTNFGHRAESTVGLQQMKKLGSALGQDYDNPFQKAQDFFVGKIAGVTTLNMQAYVRNAIGGDLNFELEYVNGKQVQVVKGRIDPGNTAGSEYTDKRAFNKYIKDYYQKQMEKAFDGKNKKTVVKSWGYKTVADFKGSKTYREKTRDLVANTVVKELSKAKGVKKSTSAKKPKNSKIKKKVKSPIKQQNVKVKSKNVRVNKAKRAKGVSRAAGTAAANPVGLKNLIQKALPQTIEKNMGLPALVNRTGRFRQSAEIQDVIPLPKSVEIRYSYQTDPYQVFEPEFGNPLATNRRDPKRIIGGSIREIAQQIMGNRFGLVRTKRV